MKLGTLDIKKAYLGTLELTNNNAFIGTVPVIDEIRAVKFTASQVNSTIGLTKISSNQILEYSNDLKTWTPVTTETVITLSNIGNYVYFRGILNGANSTENYTQFNMSGKITADGDCAYLWNYTNPQAPLKSYCGFRMFQSCSALIVAPKLSSMALAGACYREMFWGCGITETPDLPALELKEACYYAMFCYCGNLTTIRPLPATKMAPSCYANMFQLCASLVETPDLPATELANGCYYEMFAECAKLKTVTNLPAAVLVPECYRLMFYHSGAVNYIKCLATDISAENCTSGMTNGVSVVGTFVKHPLMDDWRTDGNGIPSGWTVENNISNDEIWYKSSNGEIVIPYKATSLPTVISNTYSQGMGTIKFTDNITSIGGSVFYGCDTLASITLPSTVTNIGNQAFGGCLDLTVISIPNSVTSIGNSAFYNCFSLPSISIPNSIRSIEDWAFQDCSILSSIYYRGTIAEWSSVTKGTYWNDNIPTTVVHCTDGDVSI